MLCSFVLAFRLRPKESANPVQIGKSAEPERTNGFLAILTKSKSQPADASAHSLFTQKPVDNVVVCSAGVGSHYYTSDGDASDAFDFAVPTTGNTRVPFFLDFYIHLYLYTSTTSTDPIICLSFSNSNRRFTGLGRRTARSPSWRDTHQSPRPVLRLYLSQRTSDQRGPTPSVRQKRAQQHADCDHERAGQSDLEVGLVGGLGWVQGLEEGGLRGGVSVCCEGVQEAGGFAD